MGSRDRNNGDLWGLLPKPMELPQSTMFNGYEVSYHQGGRMFLMMI